MRAERADFTPPDRFKQIVGMIWDGEFGWQEYFMPLVHSIEHTDHYLVANDFQSYIDAQARLLPSLAPTFCCS